jgi:hypothetical protein
MKSQNGAELIEVRLNFGEQRYALYQMPGVRMCEFPQMATATFVFMDGECREYQSFLKTALPLQPKIEEAIASMTGDVIIPGKTFELGSLQSYDDTVIKDAENFTIEGNKFRLATTYYDMELPMYWGAVELLRRMKL